MPWCVGNSLILKCKIEGAMRKYEFVPHIICVVEVLLSHFHLQTWKFLAVFLISLFFIAEIDEFFSFQPIFRYFTLFPAFLTIFSVLYNGSFSCLHLLWIVSLSRWFTHFTASVYMTMFKWLMIL